MITEKQIRDQLVVLEKLKDLFDGKEKPIIDHAIELLDNILYSDEKAKLQDYGGELYLLLDNDEGELGLSQLQECEEDTRKCVMLDCAIDSIAIASRYAYEKAGQSYFPEPIELVSEKTIQHLEKSLEKLGT